MEADEERMDRGEEPLAESVNTVEDVPQEFRNWVKDNEERIANAKSLPYFLRDNGTVQNGKWVRNTQKLNGIAEGNKPLNAPSGNNVSKGEFVDISTKDITEKLRELSKDFTHEEAYIELADGRVYHKVGGNGEVNFTAAEKKMFAGADLYHNHDNNTLSPNDIAFMYTNRLSSIVAITNEKQYIALLPDNLEDYTYEYIIVNLRHEAEDIVIEKMAKMNSVEADKARLNLQHLCLVELCKILNIKYIID